MTMAFPTRKLTAVCEITTGQLYDVVLPPAHEGEAGAIEVSVKLEYGGSAASVSGMKPSMYLYDKIRDAMTDSVDMALSGSTITGTMPEAFFAISSRMLLCLVLTDTASGCTMTVGTLPLEVKNVRGGTVLSTRAPSISEVVYVGRAPYLSSANTWMVWDTSKGKYVDSGVSAVGAGTFFTAPQNLLDNSYFTNAVNQRGASSYSGTWVPCIDRWRCTTPEGTSVWTGSKLSVPSGGKIIQALPIKVADVIGKTYTLAFGTTTGTVYIGTGTVVESDATTVAHINAGKNSVWIRLYSVANSEYLYVDLTNNSEWSLPLLWAVLYEGVYTEDTLPPHVPKPFMVELAECQRYYENSWYGKEKSGQRQYMANCISYAQADCVISFRVPKRIAPTITFHPEGNYTEWQIYNGAYFGVGSVVAQNRDGINAFMARITKSEADTSTWTAGMVICARGHWEASAEI